MRRAEALERYLRAGCPRTLNVLLMYRLQPAGEEYVRRAEALEDYIRAGGERYSLPLHFLLLFGQPPPGAPGSKPGAEAAPGIGGGRDGGSRGGSGSFQAAADGAAPGTVTAAEVVRMTAASFGELEKRALATLQVRGLESRVSSLNFEFLSV